MRREKSLKIPLSAVTGLMDKLAPADWLILREWLDEKLAEREDELMIKSPRLMREIRQARQQYETGNYVTLKKHKRARRV